MKIAFFCGYPFGLRGTPGTYKFVEKIKFFAEILVFTPPRTQDCVFETRAFPTIPILSFQRTDHIDNIVSILGNFEPDIVYIFNFREWPDFFKILKSYYPKAKYILDIKTPLLVEGVKRHSIQSKSNAEHSQLDAIVTLSKESVKTWIPECKIEPFEYPLGIDINLFSPKIFYENKSHFSKFVYIGTLSEKRKTKNLIYGFAKYCRSTGANASLDIFGSGPEIGSLYSFIDNSGLKEIVQLHGLVQQDKLLPMLSNYDVGIAWVPSHIYNHSPSLKLLEFMAAGLPVMATDTNAHRKLLSQGFSFHLFKDNEDSLADSLAKFIENGFSKEQLLSNLESVKQFDYNNVVRDYIVPVIERLLNHSIVHNIDTNKISSCAKYSTKYKENELKSDTKIHYNCSTKKSRFLKIFFLAEMLAAGKGGAERVAMETANEMAKRGHLVYTSFKNKGKVAYQSRQGVILLPYDRFDVLADQIRNINPDLYFVFYFNRKLINFYSLVHGTNIPFGIQECTNPQRLCQRNWGAGKLQPTISIWERELMGSAAARIRMTMPRYALSFPHYIRPQICTYPNPAFPQNLISNPAGNPKQRKTILNVNGFKANKNLITLLQAFGNLASDFPKWDIKVIGKSPFGKEPHKRALLDFIENNHLKDRVLITGPVDDVYSHYAAAHIHAISSLSEGCPTVVLEAMSVGLPSVGYADCSGTNELIRHESNGLLAEPEDRVGGLEGALRRMMSSSELRSRLGSQALSDSKDFDPKKIYDQWEQLFIEAAEYKNDPGRLFREQLAIDPERAMHARRMRNKLVQQIKE